MKKSKMMLLIGLSAASLAGLIFLQIQWMENAAGLQQQQWCHRVDMAMWWVRDQLAQHPPPPAGASTVPAPALSGPARDALLARTDSLLRVAFRHYDVQFQYDYASMPPVPADDPAAGQIVGYGYCPLTAFLGHRGVRLQVLPQDRLAFFARMKLLVAASALLTTLTIACFLAALSALFKQKKLWAMTTDFVNNMTHEFGIIPVGKSWSSFHPVNPDPALRCKNKSACCWWKMTLSWVSCWPTASKWKACR